MMKCHIHEQTREGLQKIISPSTHELPIKFFSLESSSIRNKTTSRESIRVLWWGKKNCHNDVTLFSYFTNCQWMSFEEVMQGKRWKNAIDREIETRENRLTIHQLQKIWDFGTLLFLFNFGVKWEKILSIHALQWCFQICSTITLKSKGQSTHQFNTTC